jgi:hypothetical protein
MRRIWIGIAASFIATTFLLAGCQSPPRAIASTPPLSAWVELAPGDKVDVRAVTTATACPDLTVDGKPIPMIRRGAADSAFPVTVCSLSIPRSAKSATLDGKALPLVPAQIRRIVLFGDTGCRLKGKEVQLCNDPAAWPFARVAAQAAARHPDLVIHLGDYLYRETPCPAGVAGCAGTPVGDNWDVWSKDFFAPADPLLKAAPWVMVRGNHELCSRAGRGWFRLLDPADPRADCIDFSPPYAVGLDGLSLAVLDSAESDDSKPTPRLVNEYAEGVASVAAGIQGPFWLLTHRPIWALDPEKGASASKPAFRLLNLTEQAALDPKTPANMDMAVSGHIHTFASYDFAGKRPAQLVAGVGGTLSTEMMIAAGSAVTVDGLTTRDAFAMTQYGYLVLDRTATGWDGALYNAGDDRILARCSFAGRSASCH